ncbi:hypothetical protein [Bradyrhizobium sp. RDM4]|uniref:hypothetical protein n=1 Tax=Bradyrhizobium sp. RDM4 TaxID=3378765 RepID=UPI0038FCB68C
MVDKVYPKWKETLMQAGANSSLGGTVKALLVDADAYTYDDAHQFLSDVASGARVATSAALTSKTFTAGVFKAGNTTFSLASGNPCEAVIIFIDTGSAATSQLAAYIDGKQRVDIAANAATSATSIVPEDLPADIASGATLTKISGTGPTTMTTTASASAGARALAVSAIGSGITAGAVYEYLTSGVNFPITPNGGDINLNFDTGANGIFAL